MSDCFVGFDLSNFWKDSDYAQEAYTEPPPTEKLITSIERELGVRLPDCYVILMKTRNGGIPHNRCFPTETPTSWAEDHVAISGIMGIGREKRYSLCGDLGSQFMQEEWGYPNIGICICDCPSAGHDMIMLDYRKCGKDGEPEVVHVDQENDYEITFLSGNFETFIRGLVNDSVYDTSAEDLKKDLKKIEGVSFSTLLAELIAKTDETDFGAVLRRICRKLTEEKGYFALHADEKSYLVYDIQFYLFSSQNLVASDKDYLSRYTEMIAFGDGEFSTGGYAPGFVEDWINERISAREIVKSSSGSLKLSDEFVQDFMRRIAAYE